MWIFIIIENFALYVLVYSRLFAGRSISRMTASKGPYTYAPKSTVPRVPKNPRGRNSLPAMASKSENRFYSSTPCGSGNTTVLNKSVGINLKLEEDVYGGPCAMNMNNALMMGDDVGDFGMPNFYEENQKPVTSNIEDLLQYSEVIFRILSFSYCDFFTFFSFHF